MPWRGASTWISRPDTAVLGHILLVGRTSTDPAEHEPGTVFAIVHNRMPETQPTGEVPLPDQPERSLSATTTSAPRIR